MIRRAGPLLSRLAAVVVAAGLAATSAAAADDPPATTATCGPTFSATGPDAEAYGVAQNYPLGSIMDRTRQDRMVAIFSNFDKVVPAHEVAAPPVPSALARSCEPMAWHYEFDGERRTVADYLARHPATGLLIARGSTILFEHYQYGRRDTDLFTSQSMVKTMVAMLVGIALKEGGIRSLDDLAQDYVPELKDSAYGGTPLRALLTMSSGVAFTETYDGTDDLSHLARDLRRSDRPTTALLLARYNERAAPPLTRFAYASSETEVLGLVLMAATGRHLSNYLSEKIWRPMGAEADASWGVDGRNQELAYCCLNARLRDYARFGLLLARDGGGIIPSAWISEATTAPPESFRAPGIASPFYGYGYQVWIVPAKRRMFAMLGSHGQAIFVDPASRLVLVHTAVRLKPNRDPAARELPALWYGLVREFGIAAAR